MPYADTSANLHLYEYKNTGPGANRSGRAKWTGLRALTDEEAPKYTLQSVVSGSDGWDPSATAPVTATFKWTGAGAGSGWLLPGNWDPQAVPGSSQAAYVDGVYTITADGGLFPADLTLVNGATMAVTAPSEVAYLAIGGASISAAGNVHLDGRIRTKDSLSISVSDTFALNATLTGVHRIEKTGAGTLRLNGDNSTFSGYWEIISGSIVAAKANTLGRTRNVTVDTLATLIVETGDAIFAETPLSLQPGGRLHLQANIVLREFYLGGNLQAPGVYSSSSHPNWISEAVSSL
ncbi:MAG: autotransporter-associated beta strand repeat-containing protein [Haliscomenobacter sp.]|nr:autotransporter-associated beta strand repeat-containing protein [Haliscomenobacter sp.]